VHDLRLDRQIGLYRRANPEVFVLDGGGLLDGSHVLER